MKNLFHFGNLKTSSLKTYFQSVQECPDALVVNFCIKCRNFLRAFIRFMQRTLAPLRRIVTRELEVLAWRRNSEIPQSFVIHDHLECGHVSACLSWDIFDLLSGYTTNPEVSAKRHRCRPCAQLLASKKPVSSVALTAKAGAA